MSQARGASAAEEVVNPRCPRCGDPLVVASLRGSRVVCCARCGGFYMDQDDLELVLGSRARRWQALPLDQDRTDEALLCPNDNAVMEGFSLRFGKARARVSRCPACQGVWLDDGVLDRFEGVVRSASSSLPPVVEPTEEAELPLISGGDRLSTALAFFLRVPMAGDLTLHRVPVVTLGLVGLLALAYLMQSAPGPSGLDPLAAVLDRTQGGEGLAELLRTSFASLLARDSLAYMVGNLLFLLSIGSQVEDQMGRVEALALFVITGLAANLAWMASTQGTIEPSLGAAGAISGMLGALVALRPGRPLLQPVGWLVLRVPVALWAVAWLGLQVWWEHAGVPGVSWQAHVGGFMAGLILVGVMRTTGIVRADG